MDEFEPELKRRLDVRASTIAVDDDWDDLINRSVSKARRTNKALALALVAVVCGASIAVVVAARGSDPAATRAGVPVAGVTRTGAKVPTIAPQIAPVTEFGQVVTDVRTRPVPGVQSTPLIAAFAGDPSSPMAHVFTRTTPTGASIRTYRANFDTSWVSGPPWWTAPGWCNPNGMVQADVSDDAIAGIGIGHTYADTKSDTGLGAVTTIIGVVEQHAMWVVVAQVPPDAASVRAVFPGGATDQMEPVDGVAVLVGSGPPDGTKTAKLQKLDVSGAVTGSIDVQGTGAWIETSLNADDCMAPSTLPPGLANCPSPCSIFLAAKPSLVSPVASSPNSPSTTMLRCTPKAFS